MDRQQSACKKQEGTCVETPSLYSFLWLFTYCQFNLSSEAKTMAGRQPLRAVCAHMLRSMWHSTCAAVWRPRGLTRQLTVSAAGPMLERLSPRHLVPEALLVLSCLTHRLPLLLYAVLRPAGMRKPSSPASSSWVC